MTEFESKVYEAVRKIPKGKVSTYNLVAIYLGKAGAARAVGNALHKNPDPEFTPCYRIVNGNGRLATNFGFGGMAEQARRLEQDGIDVCFNKVDLKKYLYKFDDK